MDKKRQDKMGWFLLKKIYKFCVMKNKRFKGPLTHFFEWTLGYLLYN